MGMGMGMGMAVAMVMVTGRAVRVERRYGMRMIAEGVLGVSSRLVHMGERILIDD
jgi:hypothetical protein